MFYLKKSKIPKAGKGLFTDQTFKRGDIVIEYEGEIITWAECERRAAKGFEGYAFYITKTRCIDAYFTPEALGRYANDAKGITRVEGLRNNAEYEIKTRNGEKRVFIVATRTIRSGDEILVDYGDDYWQNLEKTKPLYEKMRKQRREELKAKRELLKNTISGKRKSASSKKNPVKKRKTKMRA